MIDASHGPHWYWWCTVCTDYVIDGTSDEWLQYTAQIVVRPVRAMRYDYLYGLTLTKEIRSKTIAMLGCGARVVANIHDAVNRMRNLYANNCSIGTCAHKNEHTNACTAAASLCAVPIDVNYGTTTAYIHEFGCFHSL